MANDRFKDGMTVRKAVLGIAHVERSEKNKTDLDADFQRFITETVWGTIWTRPDLDLKIRHMVTIAVLAALGKTEELALHIRATRNTGISQAELREIFMHVAVYAGVPAANTAFSIAKRVYGESANDAD